MRKRLRWVQVYRETGDAGLVCRRSGISYTTLRKWMRRCREAGGAGLVSRSRCPTRSPNRRIFEHERDLILSLRRDRKLGARRIQHELRRHHDLSLSLDCNATASSAVSWRNYLSGLAGQSGGPQGRSDTIAGSQPIVVHDRPPSDVVPALLSPPRLPRPRCPVCTRGHAPLQAGDTVCSLSYPI
ncbi:MAG: helix-turn-helix domain containing protein [Nitrospira sp.]|nr:helix-turn-helix domain containing protein [Nitrospira sp.]